MTNHETQALRAVLTVTVETRPDGGHYFDQSDFTAHVAEWVRSSLRDKHAVGEVTVAEAAAVSVPPPAPRADDQAAVRDRIAAAIWERQNPGRRYADCEYRWQADAEADADAVLAVLPEPADRVAVLAEVADWLKVWRPEFFERWAITEQERYEGGVDDAAAELRRLAAEPGPVAGEQQNETPEGDGCWCGHPEDRHWAGSTRMTFPDGCHDCRGWNGAHGYGQELPWLPEGDEPAAGVRQDGAQQ